MRNAFRLLVYPTLLYVLGVYSHAKYNDPDGFTALKIAFNIPDWSTDNTAHVVIAPEDTGMVSNDNPDTLLNDTDDTTPTAPKAKTVKLTVNPVGQDLIEQRQVLYDVAMHCRLLEAAKFPSKLQCHTEFPYYERPGNPKLFENARMYTSHMEAALASIKAHHSALISVAKLDTFATELENFIKECGPPCLPLAKTIFDQPELPETEAQQISADYKTRFDSIDKLIQSNLQQSHTNILASLPATLPAKKITELTSIDSENKKIHRAALVQLNDHFQHLKEQKIITPERIDQTALIEFFEYVRNIKFK